MFVVGDEEALSRKESFLLRKLRAEYTPELLRRVLLPLLDQSSPVSLRVLDWAVVNWSKQHNVVCSSQTPGQMVHVHEAYRNALMFWKRRLFDPFRRRGRMQVVIDGAPYETTLGQANFALFIYQTGILAYVLHHLDEIEADMNAVSQKQKQARRQAAKEGRRKPRTELTRKSSLPCIVYTSPVTFKFD